MLNFLQQLQACDLPCPLKYIVAALYFDCLPQNEPWQPRAYFLFEKLVLKLMAKALTFFIKAELFQSNFTSEHHIF